MKICITVLLLLVLVSSALALSPDRIITIVTRANEISSKIDKVDLAEAAIHAVREEDADARRLLNEGKITKAEYADVEETAALVIQVLENRIKQLKKGKGDVH